MNTVSRFILLLHIAKKWCPNKEQIGSNIKIMNTVITNASKNNGGLVSVYALKVSWKAAGLFDFLSHACSVSVAVNSLSLNVQLTWRFTFRQEWEIRLYCDVLAFPKLFLFEHDWFSWQSTIDLSTSFLNLTSQRVIMDLHSVVANFLHFHVFLFTYF